ncbi:MAG: hypothetical protein ABSG41_02920 [Bryobacteraceae bacterium]|jgi:hypothetical protein
MADLPALNSQLDFIRSFHFTAAPPFETLLRQFTPRYETADEEPPDEFEKWQEARKGLEVLGQFGLTLVQKAILDYLRVFVIDMFGPDAVPKRKGSAFLTYEKLLLNRTTFRWEDSPVSRNCIEQINLCRNGFIHDESEIDSSQPRQSEDHFKKQPASPFVDRLDRAVRMAFAQANAEEWRETPGLLTVSRFDLFCAIKAARQFCTFVETQKAQLAEGR